MYTSCSFGGALKPGWLFVAVSYGAVARLIVSKIDWINFYPMLVCAVGLCIWSHQFVCMQTEIDLFSVLPSCWLYYTTFSWNSNASKVVFYVQQIVQTEQLMLVLIRRAWNIVLNLRYATPHLHVGNALCNWHAAALGEGLLLCDYWDRLGWARQYMQPSPLGHSVHTE